MKIPICKCGYMLASKTIRAYGTDASGQGYSREEVAWVCANKDCEAGKSGNFVEPLWTTIGMTIGIDPGKEVK